MYEKGDRRGASPRSVHNMEGIAGKNKGKGGKAPNVPSGPGKVRVFSKND